MPPEGEELPTETDVAACPKPRGRPRSATCHLSILSATNELLEERSYGDVSMEAIAARAGVAKQTLYNWWHSKAELTMEAFVTGIERQSPAPDTGSFESDLVSYLVSLSRVFSRGNMAPTFAGLIAEIQRDPELARQFRDSFISPRRRGAAELVRRGIRRGEVREDIDVEELLDMMYGPLWYRLLLRNAPLDEHFARSIAAYLLASARAQRVAKVGRAAPKARAAKPSRVVKKTPRRTPVAKR